MPPASCHDTGSRLATQNPAAIARMSLAELMMLALK
jgi:hypothetical protein